MKIFKLIIELLQAIIWPSTVFFFIVLFRKEIKYLVMNIKKIKTGSFEATLQREKLTALVEETADELNSIESAKMDSKEKEKLKEEYKTQQFQRLIRVTTSPMKNKTMLVFASNESRDLNLKYNLYYDPVYRNNNTSFKYIGLYAEKEVYAVGELTKIVSCNFINGQLIGTNGEDIKNLTTEEYNRIINIIKENDSNKEGKIAEGMKFYLVDNFYATHFRKRSDSSLRAKKYFWLDEIEGFYEGMKSYDLAKLLNLKEWD